MRPNLSVKTDVQDRVCAPRTLCLATAYLRRYTAAVSPSHRTGSLRTQASSRSESLGPVDAESSRVVHALSSRQLQRLAVSESSRCAAQSHSPLAKTKLRSAVVAQAAVCNVRDRRLGVGGSLAAAGLASKGHHPHNWAVETDALGVRSLRSQARGRRSPPRYTDVQFRFDAGTCR